MMFAQIFGCVACRNSR